MKTRCPNCGFEDEGNFCSKCGAPLPAAPNMANSVADLEGAWTEKCPVCRNGSLQEVIEKKLFGGMRTTQNFQCNSCHALFVLHANKYRLTKVDDKSLQVWREYGGKDLTKDEWKRITCGGMSDANQREADIQAMLTDIKEGKIESGKFICANSPIIVKANEEPLVVLPNIELWEPRSVTRTFGGYGGPSFRIAKGVSWRMGAFGAQSESHEELRTIDKGTLTVTNKRLVFTGTKRTTDISIARIITVDPYTDGIAVKTSGRAKVQYFVGLYPKDFVAHITVNGREYNEPFSGLWLACIIEGIAKRQ